MFLGKHHFLYGGGLMCVVWTGRYSNPFFQSIHSAQLYNLAIFRQGANIFQIVIVTYFYRIFTETGLLAGNILPLHAYQLVSVHNYFVISTTVHFWKLLILSEISFGANTTWWLCSLVWTVYNPPGDCAASSGLSTTHLVIFSLIWTVYNPPGDFSASSGLSTTHLVVVVMSPRLDCLLPTWWWRCSLGRTAYYSPGSGRSVTLVGLPTTHLVVEVQPRQEWMRWRQSSLHLLLPVNS